MSWSHFVEIIPLKTDLQRDFYAEMCRIERWNVRTLRENAGILTPICCHCFRTTGITNYLENGGTLEKAQAMAAHESPKTTKLYYRTADAITLDEVGRIAI